MFYLKDNGKKLPISCDNVYTICPQCGREHKVDLQEILEGGDTDLDGTQVYCEECSEERESKRLKVCPGGADKMAQAIARRFRIDVKAVQEIVRSGMDAGLSANACYLGAQLAMSMATGDGEMQTLREIADSLGCPIGEAVNRIYEDCVVQVTKAIALIFQAAIDSVERERGLNE